MGDRGRRGRGPRTKWPRHEYAGIGSNDFIIVSPVNWLLSARIEPHPGLFAAFIFVYRLCDSIYTIDLKLPAFSEAIIHQTVHSHIGLIIIVFFL